MEKNRGSKILAIIALLVSAVGLSLGFAAFSQTLTIRSSASVKPTSTDFKVVFSSSSTAVETNPVIPVGTPTTIVNPEDKTTIINSGNPKISGLTANFTAPGQKVVYTFYAANIGEYDAYLNNIAFANVGSENSTRSCTANSGTTNALVQVACNDISLKIKVGEELETNSSLDSIKNHLLVKGGFEPVVVTIEYAADGARADGDFSVSFGDITLNYGTMDA